MYRMARADTESLNNYMFFYIMVLLKNIDSWEIFEKKKLGHKISISSSLI